MTVSGPLVPPAHGSSVEKSGNTPTANLHVNFVSNVSVVNPPCPTPMPPATFTPICTLSLIVTNAMNLWTSTPLIFRSSGVNTTFDVVQFKIKGPPCVLPPWHPLPSSAVVGSWSLKFFRMNDTPQSPDRTRPRAMPIRNSEPFRSSTASSANTSVPSFSTDEVVFQSGTNPPTTPQWEGFWA